MTTPNKRNSDLVRSDTEKVKKTENRRFTMAGKYDLEAPILARLHRQSEPTFIYIAEQHKQNGHITETSNKSNDPPVFIYRRDSIIMNGKFNEPRLSIACPESEPRDETPWRALGQLIIPFIIAGCGNVAAGIILDTVQHWDAFTTIPQFLILVPALLGLKGNVEMTLASRLSTHANMGHLDLAGQLKALVISNMALVQCQASTVGLIAPLVAIALSFITNQSEHHKTIGIEGVVLVTSCAVITANIANLLLGTLMCTVIIFSRKFNINPDNIATPIAASVGDFATMLILAYVSQGLFGAELWVSILLLAVLILFTPVWAYIAWKCMYTRHVLYTGWIPILGAMLLQNAGGLIMENGLTRYNRIAAFQPIINGVGGNLAAVQSSRISTFLHKEETKDVSFTNNKLCISPFGVFFGDNPHSLMARLLFSIAAPSHLLFLSFLRLIKAHFIFTVLLVVFYLTAALVQVAILLTLSYYIVNLLWRKGIDPDNNAIPFLTAFADLLGSGLLFLTFYLLYTFNDPNASMEIESLTNSTIF